MRALSTALLLLVLACTPAKPPPPPTLTPAPVILERLPPPGEHAGPAAPTDPMELPTAVVAEGPTPTPLPVESVARSEETEALASAPPADARRGDPTPVALPPSARLVVALT
ncbi:MAG: hypothetical protein IRZ14_18560, partial [Chloroflexi bacterium]|nr:hypothetical protein [Chloroflexota bacterium]